MVVRWWSLRERANVAVRAELVVLYDARDDVGMCQRELTCEGRSAWSIALANACPCLLRAKRPACTPRCVCPAARCWLVHRLSVRASGVKKEYGDLRARTSSTLQRARNASALLSVREGARKPPASGKPERREREERFVPAQGRNEQRRGGWTSVRRRRVRAQFEMHCAAATAPLPDEFRGPILLIGELVVSTWAEMRRSRLGGLGAGSWLEGGKHRGTGSEKYGPRVASIFWMFRHEGVVRRLREWEAPFEVFATRTVRPQRRTQVRRRRDVSAMRARGLVQRWRGSRGMGRRGSRGVGWRICVPVDLACPRAVAAVSACEAGSRGRRQRCVVWTWTADERACRPSVTARCCCAFRGGGASRRDGHVRGDRDGGVRGDRNGGRGCPSTHDPGPSLLRVPHVWLDRVDEGGGAWCRDGDVRGDWDGGVQVDSDGERACPSTHYPGPLLLRVPRVWLAPADEDGGLRVEWDGGVWPSTYAPAGRRSAFPALASDLLEVVRTSSRREVRGTVVRRRFSLLTAQKNTSRVLTADMLGSKRYSKEFGSETSRGNLRRVSKIKWKNSLVSIDFDSASSFQPGIDHGVDEVCDLADKFVERFRT
ncbi:hypothetical protein BKA93DRAFT_754641 [Sparassis latifolia]